MVKSTFFKVIIFALVAGSSGEKLAAMERSYEEQMKELSQEMITLSEEEYNAASLDKVNKIVQTAIDLDKKEKDKIEPLASTANGVGDAKRLQMYTSLKSFFFQGYFYFKGIEEVADEELVTLKSSCISLYRKLEAIISCLKLWDDDLYVKDLRTYMKSFAQIISFTKKYEADPLEKIRFTLFGRPQQAVNDCDPADGELKGILTDANIQKIESTSLSEKKSLEKFKRILQMQEDGVNNAQDKLIASMVWNYFNILESDGNTYASTFECADCIEVYEDEVDIPSKQVPSLGGRHLCGSCFPLVKTIAVLKVLCRICEKLKKDTYQDAGDMKRLGRVIEFYLDRNIQVFSKHVSYNGIMNSEWLQAQYKTDSDVAEKVCEKLEQIEDHVRESAELQPDVFKKHSPQVYVNLSDDFYHGLKGILTGDNPFIFGFHNKRKMLKAMEKLCVTLLVKAGLPEEVVQNFNHKISDIELVPCETFLSNNLALAPHQLKETMPPQISYDCVTSGMVGEYFIEKLKSAPRVIRDWLELVRSLKGKIDKQASGDNDVDALQDQLDKMRVLNKAKGKAAKSGGAFMTYDEWWALFEGMRAIINRDRTDNVGDDTRFSTSIQPQLKVYSAYALNVYEQMAAALCESADFQLFVVRMNGWYNLLKSGCTNIYNGFSAFYKKKDTTFIFDVDDKDFKDKIVTLSQPASSSASAAAQGVGGLQESLKNLSAALGNIQTGLKKVSNGLGELAQRLKRLA